MITIASVTADWVLDSRAVPTIEATVTLSDGRQGFAQAPSGASTGMHESLERRDTDDRRFAGRGVMGAAASVREEISGALRGMDPRDQSAIDQRLVDLDATPDRSHLGANAMVAVSAACARVGAVVADEPLWEHLAGGRQPSLPLPMVNLFSGNLHARGGMTIQDVLIVPFAAPDMATSIEWAHDIYHAAKDILTSRGASTLVGDEGGFGAPSSSSEECIALACDAIVRAGRVAGEEVGIALDVAATHMLQTDGSYVLDGDRISSAQLVATLARWLGDYPIVSIEDPLAEDDWDGWHVAASTFDTRVQLLGDDLLCTHLDRLERAASVGCANAVLVKANQIGTLSEALAVADRARELGMRSVVSARSGETEDDWLADLAVASGAGQIKVGSVARSERLSKYNRLLRIARSHDAPAWSGSNGFERLGSE
ncbi:MAG TPA: enolase C-terminal domain-like protein [Acidimicrobiales bacterium]